MRKCGKGRTADFIAGRSPVQSLALQQRLVLHVLQQRQVFVVFVERIRSSGFHLAGHRCTLEDALQPDLVRQEAKTPSFSSL